ncbi:unnamed protein product [Closterium sp. NIES-65]|nr:unnamed protein product [Closterium sp. NIES-65]
MGSHTLTAPVRVFSWTARLLELVFLALLITFVAYLSKDQTAAPLAVYGGLSACFNCDNGWNWHVLLMGIAFGIAMTESLLTFCSSSLSAFRIAMTESLLTFCSGSLRATGYAKWVHLAWQTIALILTAVAMAAIIVAKGTEHKHMYSVHTYCGVLTLALFAVQFFWGLCAFVLLKSRVLDDLQGVVKNSEKHPAVCHSVYMPAALSPPLSPHCSSSGPCFFWGLCAFVLFKSRLSEATRYQMGTYHILLGKFTYYAGIGTCVMGTYHIILLGKFTYYAGIGTCVVSVTLQVVPLSILSLPHCTVWVLKPRVVAALLVLALTGHGQDQGQATKIAHLEHPDPPTPAHLPSANATAKPNHTLVPPPTIATGAASSLPAGVLSDSAVPRQYLAGAAAVGGSGGSGGSASVQEIYAKLTGRQVVPARGDPKAYGFLNATIHRDSSGALRLEYKVIIIGLSRDAPPRKMSAHRGRKGEAGAHHERLLDLPCGPTGRRAGRHAADSASLTVTCAGAVGGSAEELRVETGRGAGEHEAGKGDRFGNTTGSTSNEASTTYFASSERDQHLLWDAVRVILQEPESYYVTVSTTHYAGGAIRGQLGRVFGQEV